MQRVWIDTSVVEEKLNQFFIDFNRWFCKRRSQYNNESFWCLKTSNRIIAIFFEQRVQQLYKLPSIKMMKSYLFSGILILVEPNWRFSHLLLPLEFLFGIIITDIFK